MRKFAIFMSGLILFMLMIPSQSYACDCVILDDPLAEKEKYDAVFTGEVVEIIDKSKNKRIQSSADLLEIKVIVTETWKGVEDLAVTLFTERDSASCGFPFEVGEEYLIYANESGDKWQVNICSRTAPLTEAGEDLTAFGEGKEPIEQADPYIKEDEQEGVLNGLEINNSNTIIIALMVVILLGVIIGFMRKK